VSERAVDALKRGVARHGSEIPENLSVAEGSQHVVGDSRFEDV
jgi:hypothetical protein